MPEGREETKSLFYTSCFWGGLGAVTKMRNPYPEINTEYSLYVKQSLLGNIPPTVTPVIAVYFITHIAISLDAFQ